MADYSAYIPGAGSITFPTQISNFILASEAIDTEIENARGAEANLLAKINLKLNRTGGTLTGNLILAGDPSADLHAIPRQYATNNYLPLTGGDMTGTLTIGTYEVVVTDTGLTNTYLVSTDSNGRITTASGLVTTNLALLSDAQEFTILKAFDTVPAFNGGTSGVSAAFTVDSTFVVTNLNTELLDNLSSVSYAPIDSPAFTGTLSLPTGTTAITQTITDDTTKIATTEFVQDVYAQIDINPEWTSAYQIGSSFSVPGTGDPALAALNSTDVAFADWFNDELRTYRWNGSTWVLVGTPLSITPMGTPAMDTLNSTDIAFVAYDDAELKTYRWNGSTWSLVGTALAISGVSAPALTALNSTDVAFIDPGNDELRTYRFNGSTWSQVGNSLSITTGTAALAALNSTDVAFIDVADDELRTYRFDGTDWAQVGSSLSITGNGIAALATLNSTDIAYIDATNNQLRTYRFNGSTWSQVGGVLAIANVGAPAIKLINGTDLAFIDSVTEELRTYRLGYSI